MKAFSFRIVDLTADHPDRIEQTAALLLRTFRGRSEAWQDIESARRTVVASFDNGHISRIALDDGGNVVGWSVASRCTTGTFGRFTRLP
jgi:aminoglycoside 6'-N-acetyltransferase I